MFFFILVKLVKNFAVATYMLNKEEYRSTLCAYIANLEHGTGK